MNKLFVAVLLITLAQSIITVDSISINITNINVKLNDLLELECDQPAFNNKTSILINKKDNSTMNGFDIFIFKKDNVLINLFRSKLKVIVSNQTDQGVYECGYYRFDKYGSLNYEAQNAWTVNITGIYSKIFNIFK